MRRGASILCAVALSAACEAPRAIVELPLQSGAESALLALELERGTSVRAFRPTEPFHVEELFDDPSARLVIAYYGATLEALGLEVGAVDASGARGGDPLPPPLTVLETSVDEGGLVAPWAMSARADDFDGVRGRARPCPELVAERPIAIHLTRISGLVALGPERAMVLGEDARGAPQLLSIDADGRTSTVATGTLRPTALAAAGARIYLAGFGERAPEIRWSEDGSSYAPLYATTGVASRLEPAPEEGPDVLYYKSGFDLRRVDAVSDTLVAEFSRSLWTHVGPREIVALDEQDVLHFANGRSVPEVVFPGDVDHVTALARSFGYGRSFAGSSAGRIAAFGDAGWELVAETPLLFETTGMLPIEEGLLVTSFGGEVTELELPGGKLCAETSLKLGGDANIEHIARVEDRVFVAVQDKRARDQWSLSRAQRVAAPR